ncbi:MAG: hypothetical protein Q8T08_05775, partial [Ignavibacteria bacterium]|nr:hypothetical protein [Ignavibacteria bacterium]
MTIGFDENNTFTKDSLKNYYASRDDVFIIISRILISSRSESLEKLSIDGWKVIPSSTGTEFYKEFSTNSVFNDW